MISHPKWHDRVVELPILLVVAIVGLLAELNFWLPDPLRVTGALINIIGMIWLAFKLARQYFRSRPNRNRTKYDVLPPF